MGALVVLAAETGAIEPGAEAETVVLVRNTGDTPETFHVLVQGEASVWAVIDPPSVALAPGQEEPVWVRFRPPRSPDTRPGTVPFDVAVAAVGDPTFLALEHSSLEVGTYSSVAANFDGDAIVGPKWSDLLVHVRNTGNRRVTVTVDAESRTAGVQFEVDPARLDLAAGQATDVQVRVRAPRRVLPTKRDREVTISVVSDGGALATLRTEYTDEPSLVDDLFRSARALLVVLLLLFVGGVAMLRSDAAKESDDGSAAGVPANLPVAPTVAPPAQDDESSAEVPEEPAEVDASVETVPPMEANRVASPAPPLPRMAFVRVFGGNARDVIVREAGSRGNEVRIRTDNASEARPRLSPDGSRVAFVREAGGASRVCVVSSGGGEPVCVADTTAGAAVAWGADGAKLYFSRGGRLFSVPFDAATQIAGPESDVDVAVPSGQFAVSRDGTKVVTAEGRRLVVHGLDGTPSSTIEVPNSAEDPSFSPDGTRLVFTANFHVHTAPTTGGAVRQLTAPGTVNGEAAWTGDGDWVVFRSNRSGAGDLYSVKGGAGGGEEPGLAQVTATAEREITPSF